MKKILTIIAIACIAFATPSQAQVKFGLKGGLNLTSISTDNVLGGTSNKAGFFIGPTFKFTIPIVGLGFDASALYDQRKGTISGVNGNETSIKEQSIQIPINIRYGIGLGSTASIYFFAGPQFGFNVGDKNIVSSVGDWTFKSSYVSANVGAGLMLLSHLQVSVNYNFGLGKTGELEQNIPGAIKSIDDGKLNAWQIGVAYFF